MFEEFGTDIKGKSLDLCHDNELNNSPEIREFIRKVQKKKSRKSMLDKWTPVNP